jgi:RNA polymerase sigma factor (sigma-70 family)
MDKALSFEEKCQLINANYNLLIALAENILSSLSDSDDVVQEGCKLFLESQLAKKVPWLYTTVERLAWKRKKERNNTISIDDENFPEIKSKIITPSAAVINKERKELLRKAILKLKSEYRLPIILYYFQDLSAEEGAGKLGITENAFLTRLHRARQYLHNYLSGMEGMEGV